MSKQLQIRNSTAEFLIFQAEDKAEGVQVFYKDESIWATQKAMAMLFDCSTDNISLHLKNIFESGELIRESVTEKISATAADGKNYLTQFYKLDAIISVGYLVNSRRATQFRQWCTAVLRQFAIRGYDIAHYTSNTDSIEYKITEYNDNIETYYTSRDTTRRIFNATGYYADNTYYHYIKDHLGNNCAVVHSAADSVVQSTMYYASGVPMAESTGRDKQPYLYNGKEFVEAHGLNEYDSQARRYYATIMRTTTMDPMAESYYHISPYSWCGNNPIRHLDEDGQYYFDWDEWCYRSSYGNHDEVSWSEVLKNQFVEPKPQKEMGARWLVLEWARGNGGSARNFSENDNLTQQFITNNPRLEGIRELIADAIANGIESGEVDPENEKGDKYNFKLSEQENKPLIAAHDFLSFISNGKTGNVAMSVIGSYTIRWKVINRDQDGNAIVKITASNPMTVKSLIRPISDKGYSDFYIQKVSPIIDRIFSNGVGPFNYFANQMQTFTWTETIPQK
jgi:RHS repeat-associated protein